MPAGLGVRAGHIEATERMNADQGASAFAIEVEIAHMELLLRSLYALLVVRIDRAGQAILGAVRNLQCVIEILCFDDRQYRAKDLLLGNARLWGDISDNRWLNEVARAMMTAAREQATLALANLN